MLGRAQELCLGSTRKTFLSIFLLTFLTKLLFAWRTGIESGWQDETAWKRDALEKSFLETASSYDAGYPTPLLRMLSYFLAQTTTESYFFWHISVLVLMSFCVSSLSFSRLVSAKQALVIGGLLATYPSFDLLLLHNLSYWLFIPLFVIFTNFLDGFTKQNFQMILLVLFLLIATSKPQILLSVLVLCFYLMHQRKMTKSLFFSVFVVLILMLTLGRLSQSSITLDFDLESLVNFPFSLSSHFINVSLPLLTLVVYASSRIVEGPVIPGFFVLSNLFIFWRYLSSKSKSLNFKLATAVFITFSTYTLSLYFFPNSGWSQDNLLNSGIYTSLFSRHYLPIVLMLGFVIFLVGRINRTSTVVLTLAVVQNLAMQVLLYWQFYMPV